MLKLMWFWPWVKPSCPGTMQKCLAVGCRQQKRVELGICVAFCRCDSSLLQSRPGQVCDGPCHTSGNRALGGRCQLWDSLAYWRRLGLSWATLESQASPLRVLGGPGSTVASTAQCLPLGGTTWCLYQRCGLCERVPCGSPKGRFNFSYEYCSVE